MRYLKPFDKYNEGLFKGFLNGLKSEKTDDEVKRDIINQEKYDRVRLGEPGNESTDKIEDGDIFMDDKSVMMMANGKFDQAKESWDVYRVIERGEDNIKIKFLFKGGKPSNEVGEILSNDYDKWFQRKIVFK